MGQNKKIEVDGQTFIIDIKSIQNNTWQGTVLWMQTQQKIPFRSALELIHLLDSAIGRQELSESQWERP